VLAGLAADRLLNKHQWPRRRVRTTLQVCGMLGAWAWSPNSPGLLGSFVWYRPGLCQCRFRLMKPVLGPKSPDFLRPKPDLLPAKAQAPKAYPKPALAEPRPVPQNASQQQPCCTTYP
jgi:hypothetical protein